MKNQMVILLIISLLSSCSGLDLRRSPSSQVQKSNIKNCSSSIRSFFTPAFAWKSKIQERVPFLRPKNDDVTKENIELVKSWIERSNVDREQAELYKEKFLGLPLSNQEVKILLDKYKIFPKSKTKREELFFYLSWASSFHKKKRIEVLEHLSYVRQQRGRDSKIYRKFLASRKKFSKLENKEFDKELKKLHKSKGQLSDTQIQKLARSNARHTREEFENLSYACHAKVKTDANTLASARFQKFALVVSPISTASMFTYANHQQLFEAIDNEDNEKIIEWGKKLGYEVVLMSALSMVLAKVMSEPTGSYFSKVWKGAMSDIAFIKVDSMIYGEIFSASDSEIKERFEKLKSNPDYHLMLNEMQELLAKENVYKQFKKSIVSSVYRTLSIEQQREEESKIDLSKITTDQFEDPLVQNAILKAIAMQMYIEDKNESGDALSTLIHTGDKGEDRMLFFLEVAPLYHTLNVGVAALIYNTICMGKNDSSSAFKKAAMIYATWSFGYNLFEFAARQHQIGQ